MADNKTFFKQSKYGMMIHFGLYSLLGGQYLNRKGPNYAEWIQCEQKIPNSEMEKLAHIFNPIYFDADYICKFAVECGFKYIVMTSKHHEGFALFDSKYSDFTITKASPYKRDIIKDMADACKKYGLKFGLYYSQVIDWHEKDGGGFNADPAYSAGETWDNRWDFPNNADKDFDICFKEKMIPQIKELLTNYGDLFLFWFDMPLDSTKKHSKIIYDLVKKYQPDCLINSRLGNGEFDYVTLGDNEIPDKIEKINKKEQDNNSIYGFKYSPYGLYESAGTLNKSWGYSAIDSNYKSPEQIVANRQKLEKLGINYLLNVGPDWLGRIPYQAEVILRKANELYEKSKND